ncbi:hypothetical protein ACLOJK_004969 [Asimina triloba]
MKKTSYGAVTKTAKTMTTFNEIQMPTCPQIHVDLSRTNLKAKQNKQTRQYEKKAGRKVVGVEEELK